jgi:peroxiredoxin
MPGSPILGKEIMKRRLACLVVASLLLATASSGAAQGSPARGSQRQAPDFTLNDLQGRKVSMNDFRGKVILLEFFQSGCPACRLEAPLLEHLYSEYQKKGVVVVGISHDQGGVEAVKKFASEFGITYPLLMGDLEVAVRYVGITPLNPSFTIPRYFLIDRKGTIVRQILPGDAKSASEAVAQLEQALKDTLAPSPSASLQNKIALPN